MASYVTRVRVHVRYFLFCLLESFAFSHSHDQPYSQYPVSLHKEYNHELAAFGSFPPFGSVTQKVYWYDYSEQPPPPPPPNHTLEGPTCHVPDPCDHIDIHQGYPNSSEPFRAPYILMVDRSDKCNAVHLVRTALLGSVGESFVFNSWAGWQGLFVCFVVCGISLHSFFSIPLITLKARNAQHAGASALVIMDTQCVCGDTDCTPTENCREPEMSVVNDDGSGKDVSIPVILIRKQDGETFKKTLKDDGVGIMMELEFADNPQLQLNYSVWTTPLDAISRDIVHPELGLVAEAFSNQATMIPRQYIHHGREYFHCGDKQDHKDKDSCDELCTNHGRYCALTSHKHNVKGSDSVAESLRRICIRNDLDKDGDKYDKYFTYVQEFQDTCFANGKFTDQSCINNALKKANIDAKPIQACMDDNSLTAAEQNKLLDAELLARLSDGVTRHPSAVVNGRPMTKSTPNAYGLVDALCEELMWSAPVCNQCGACYVSMLGCLQYGSCSEAKKHDREEHYRKKESGGGGGWFWHFLLWTVAIGGVVGYGGWWYSHRYNPRAGGNFFGGRGANQGALLSEYMQLGADDEANPLHMQQQMTPQDGVPGNL